MTLIDNKQASSLAQVFRELYENFALANYDYYIVAFSGGSDSVVLVDLLRKLLGLELARQKLKLAYLSHGIRHPREQSLEEDFVDKQAQAWSLELSTKVIKYGFLQEQSRLKKLSLEDLARRQRYKFFAECQEHYPNSLLLTAHHQDDQLETMLMNFCRGSGLAGLSAMSLFKDGICRPLLNIAKRDLEKYRREYQLSFIVDSSNESMAQLRNRVRHQLIPELRKVFPGLARALQTGQEKYESLASMLEHMTDDFIASPAVLCHLEAPEQIKIERHAYLALEPALQVHLLQKLFNKLSKERRIPYRFFKHLVLRLPMQETSAYGLYSYLYKEFIILKKLVYLPKNNYSFIVSAKKEYSIFGYRLIVSNDSPEDLSARHIFELDKLDLPLLIRNRQVGDKVKKTFQRQQIPKHERGQIPLICDSAGVLMIVDIFSPNLRLFSNRRNFTVRSIEAKSSFLAGNSKNRTYMYFFKQEEDGNGR